MDNRSKIVRAAADTILDMAGTDPAFVDRFLADPAGTMEPLGVSASLANEAAAQFAEILGRGEVSGYATPSCKQSCCFPPKTFCKGTVKL